MVRCWFVIIIREFNFDFIFVKQISNIQQCHYTNKEFRRIQCSLFDDLDFQGERYIWEPYIKGKFLFIFFSLI